MKLKLIIILIMASTCIAAVREPYLGPSGGSLKIHGALKLYEDLELAKVGHHLAFRSEGGNLHFIPHNEFNGEISTTVAELIHAYAYFNRMIQQSDNTGSWTGTTFEYTTQPSAHMLVSKVYLQTDSTAATEPVKVCIWEGTDDTGVLVFDQTYPASVFIASTEIEEEQMGLVEYDAGVDYFIRYLSGANFSLKLNDPNTVPWLAYDVSLLRKENLLQTKEWVDGDTWAVGDYFIDSRKINVCNTAGVQSGTFASNAALWDLIGQGLNSSDRIISADGDTHAIASNDVFDVNRDGNLVIACNWLNTAIKAPTSPNTKMAVRNDYAHIDYDGITRLNIDSVDCELLSPNRNTYIHIRNSRVDIKQSGDNRLKIDASLSYIRSPNTQNDITINDTKTKITQGGVSRFEVDAVYSTVFSPDRTNWLQVGNDAANYNNGEILTVLDKGVVYGIAELDASGLVPTSQLPAYVDAIVEYASLVALQTADPQEANKIYITTDDNKMYRYTGTAGSYGEISPTIVLGTTNTTAYRGDRGLIAYDHSQTVHDTDKIISPDGLSNLTITNTSLIHNDGVDRLQINEGFTALKSPDGNVGLVVSNTGALYGVTEIATVDDLHAEYTHPTGDGNSHVPANSTTNDGKVLTASAIAGTYTWETPTVGDGTGDVIGPSSSIDYRVPTFNGTTGKLLRESQVSIGPSGDVLGVNSMVIDQLYLTDNVITKTGTGGSLTITDTVTGIVSDGGSYMAVMDGVATFFDAVRDRFYIDPTETKMVSPDGTNALTVDNNGVDINAYTKLGSAAPAIKMKKLTGTTPAVEGNSVTIAHGLTGSKILAVDVLVGYSSNVNNGMPPGYIRATGYEYYSYHTSSGVVVFLSATNSERILSDTIRILITYEE